MLSSISSISFIGHLTLNIGILTKMDVSKTHIIDVIKKIIQRSSNSTFILLAQESFNSSAYIFIKINIRIIYFKINTYMCGFNRKILNVYVADFISA